MEQTRLHIRLDFAPLDVATSVYVLSEASPATQTYNGTTGEYEPNRTLTPTVLMPQVILNAQDGSLTDALGNENLAYVKWYVDEEDITTLEDWEGLYTIVTEGDYKGALVVYKNLSGGEQHALHMEAVVADPRTGTNYPIYTDSIILATVDMTEDEHYTLGMDSDTTIAYRPIYDHLFEYEYKVSHGYAEDTTKGREDATDGTEYLKTINLGLYGSKGEYEGDYTVKVYEVLGWEGNALQLEEITIGEDDDNEFDEISADKLVIDLRMVEKRDYLIKAFIDDSEVASLQFGVARVLNAYEVMSVNGAARKISDTVRQDRAEVIVHNAQILDYPECVIRILWKTDTEYLKDVEHGEGTSVEYTIASTGAGDTSDDGWIDEYVETEHKEYHKVAVSEDDEVYCDEDGNTLIFN